MSTKNPDQPQDKAKENKGGLATAFLGTPDEKRNKFYPVY